ncbi:MAG TPA: ribonuclease P protein component [Patescibacteria group bacterium]
MFKREQRLTDKRLFATLFRRGTWVRGRIMSFILMSTPHRGKIGFVITKKVAKSAVVRNRTKRRIRATFIDMLKLPEYKEFLLDTTVAVMIHRTIDELSYEQLKSETVHLFEKLKKADPKSKLS